MSPVHELAAGSAASAMVAVHLPRTVQELGDWLAGFLAETGVEARWGLFQIAAGQRTWTLQAGTAEGLGCLTGVPWQVDDPFLLTAAERQRPDWHDGDPPRAAIPLRYHETLVGWLLLWGSIPDERRALLELLADHVAVAYTNLELLDEAVRSGEAYYGSLVAYQELDQLLRAEGVEGVVAGILRASLQTLGSNHGAVFLAGEDGRLVQRAGWGIPEDLLEQVRTASGRPWLEAVSASGAVVLRADPGTGRFPDLDPATVRPGISNLLAAPLRHEHGTCGVVVALNAPEGPDFGQHEQTFRGLCSLGAAIVHSRQLHDRALQAQRYEEQLRLAQTIQERLRPRELPGNDRIETAWRASSADFVAGDYLDLMTAPDGSVHAVVADVSGHGIGAALLMCSFRADFRSRVEQPDITRTMAGLNHDVSREVGDSGMFITAFHARIQPELHRCEVINAGHNHGILLRGTSGTIERIAATAPPLGAVAGIEYDLQTCRLEPGDMLVIYSDGITEATNDREEMFGVERLEALVTGLAAQPASAIVGDVFRAVYRFLGRERTEDDASVIVVKVLPPVAPAPGQRMAANFNEKSGG